MKLLFSTIFLVTSVFSAVAKDDPRAVSFSLAHVASGDTRMDTSKSIVIYGARDDEGLYSVQGVSRRLSFVELEKLLLAFFRDFPKDAKSSTKGFTGLVVPKPNLLYKSHSWAETKKAGRDLVTKIAKNEDVSLFFFEVNPNYSATKKKGAMLPDALTVLIDYYDNRLSSISLRLWAKTKKPNK